MGTLVKREKRLATKLSRLSEVYCINNSSAVLRVFTDTNPKSFEVGEIFIMETLDSQQSSLVIAVLEFWLKKQTGSGVGLRKVREAGHGRGELDLERGGYMDLVLILNRRERKVASRQTDKLESSREDRAADREVSPKISYCTFD